MQPVPQLHEHDVHLGCGLWYGLRVHSELELPCNWRVDWRAGVLVYAGGRVRIWVLRFCWSLSRIFFPKRSLALSRMRPAGLRFISNRVERTLSHLFLYRTSSIVPFQLHPRLCFPKSLRTLSGSLLTGFVFETSRSLTSSSLVQHNRENARARIRNSVLHVNHAVLPDLAAVPFNLRLLSCQEGDLQTSGSAPSPTGLRVASPQYIRRVARPS